MVDLETTGLDPTKGSGIIEVAGIRIENGKIEDSYTQLVNPGHTIPEKITRITGLTDRDVRDAPSPERVLEDFLEFRGGAILIAHNARFDLAFLQEFSPQPFDPEYVDTLRLARQLLNTEKHSLNFLAEQFELTRDNPHRAFDDAHATAELFLKLTERITDAVDYVRCGLPEKIMKEAPVNLPKFQLDHGKMSPSTEKPPIEWILYGLWELNTTLGVNKMAQILSGSESKSVQSYRDLQSFGRLSAFTQAEIKKTIREAINRDYIQQSGHPYPVLNLTKRGIQFLREAFDSN